MRIMSFADYKLERHSPISYDAALVSPLLEACIFGVRVDWIEWPRYADGTSTGFLVALELLLRVDSRNRGNLKGVWPKQPAWKHLLQVVLLLRRHGGEWLQGAGSARSFHFTEALFSGSLGAS